MRAGLRLHPLRLVLAAAALLLGGWTLSSTPALADLRVCNETTDSVSIALGYRADKGWQSEGWWVAPPSKCAIVFEGNLNSRYYYLYVADDIGGGAWDGSFYMCTRDESFTVLGEKDCLARGFERTGFFEVDTQNKSDWTLQLTEGKSSGDSAGAADDNGQTIDDGAATDGDVDPNASDPGSDAGGDLGAD